VKEFQTVIYKFLKNHEKHKKYLALLTVLSLVVSMAVPFSLIMPAISMTDPNAPETVIDSNNILLLGENFNNVLDWTIAAKDETYMTVSIDGKNIYNSLDGQPTQTVEVNGDTANLSVYLQYKFTNVKNGDGLISQLEGDGPHIVFGTGITGVNSVKFNTPDGTDVIDADYAAYFRDNGLTEMPAGHFTVNKDGQIIITLTSEYRTWVKEQGSNTILGSLSFSGEVGRADDEDGDQKVYIGGQEVNVTFKDHYPTINKTSSVNRDNGTIEWTITINNPYKINLADGGYTLTDTMSVSGNLLENTKVTFVPDGVGTHDGNGNISFQGDKANSENITIKYTTKITNDQIKNGKVTNSAELKKDGDTKDSSSKDEWFNNPIPVSKSGVVDYKSNDENKPATGSNIKWTINLTNTYGISLDGYKISDNMLKEAVGDITVTPSGDVDKDTGELEGVGNAKNIKIEYWAPASEGTNTNKVKVLYPDDSPVGPDTSQNVNYAKKPDINNVTKNGSYNPDTHKITWTVNVTSNDGMSLKNYKLTDTQFPDNFSGFTFSSCKYNYADKDPKSVMSYSNKTITFTGDVDTVKFTYTTDAPQEVLNAAQTTVVNNNIGFDDGSTTATKTQTVTVSGRKTITKTVVKQPAKDQITSNEIVKLLSWETFITFDGKFNGKVVIDTPSVTGDGTGATHKFKEDSVKVYAGQYSNNLTEVINDDPKSPKYTLNKNGDGYEITFNESFDSGDIKFNYVKITYDTEAIIPAGSADGNYVFNNSAKFDGKEIDGPGPGPGVTIEKINPAINKETNITFTKQWDNTDNSKKVPVKFKVKYSVNNGEWKYLKGSVGNYIYDDGDNSGYASASDLEITFDGDKSENYWYQTLNNLRDETADDKDGERQNYRKYQYKVEEVSIDGHEVTFVNENKVYYQAADGVYVGTYNPNMITNKFFPNVSFTGYKVWLGDDKEANTASDTKKVTVRLEYRPNSDSKWYPVRKVNGKYQFTGEGADVNTDTIVTAEIKRNTGDEAWSFTWNDLPDQIIVEASNVRRCEYRIIETKVDDTPVTYTGDLINDKSAKVPVDGGYYSVSYNGNKTVNNKFVSKKGLTINANKVWSGDENNLESRPTEITFKLQRQADNGAWEDYKDSEKTITAGADGTWKATWTDLPNQALEDGKVITYQYRVIECGYKFNGQNKTLLDTARDFATLNGYYEISGSPSSSIALGGDVTITNTFKKLETINITPQKKWSGDTALDSDNQPYKTNNRPQEITFTLQRSTNGTDWENVKGTIDENGNFTASTNESDIAKVTLRSSGADQLDSDGFEIWKGTQIKGLPKSVIENDVKKDYQYKFVETSYKDKNGQIKEITGDSFSTSDGEYKSSVTPIADTGILDVKNEFKEKIGVSKTALDKDANPIDSLTIDDLNDYKYTVDDKEYYIFNWLIELESEKTALVTPFVDTLPDGFTLFEDNIYRNYTVDSINVKNWTGDETLATPWDPKAENANKNGYYYMSPCIIWLKQGAQYMKRVSMIHDKNATNVKDTKGAWDFNQESPARYYYDKSANKIYFGTPSISVVPVYTYSTKIECKDLEAKIKNGSFTISNKIEMYDKDGKEPTGKEDVAELTIKTPSQLISKNYTKSIVPGYINYTIDVNPDGQDLSNGSTIDIEDIFKTLSYTDNCKNGNGKTTSGNNLVDVNMSNINLYEVDANGNESKLNTSEYVLNFEGTGTDKSALLKLTIPDEKHIRIKYTYKLIANENTPSVINECESNVRIFGVFDTMKPGYVPPSGDEIQLQNTAKIIHDGLEENSKPCNIDYVIDKAGAVIEVNKVPKIVKVNTGDYTIKNLESSFYLAKYENGRWFFATDVKTKDNGVITWDSNGQLENMISDDAKAIDVKKDEKTNVLENPKVAVDTGVLYKLIEIKFPGGYEGSNLGLTEDEFKTLITGYLNSTITNLNGTDYGVFLRNYVATHYFVYNTESNVDYQKPNEDPTINPNGFHKANVMQIKSGDNIEIPNNELIDIKVSKEWWKNAVQEPEKSGAKISVKLWWSYTKADSKPADALEASAVALGILDPTFTAVKTIDAKDIKNISDSAPVWSNLPNGKNDKPIYYYIEELNYTIDNKTYVISNGQGEYSPIYSGNALNSDGTVTVKNTSSLLIRKDWKKSNNDTLVPVEKDITVSIYGYPKKGGEKEIIIENLKLTKENNWTAEIENILGDINSYNKLEAVEFPDKSDEYTVSCVFNVNDKGVGEIVVTNKNKKATDASVSVKKVWSDGETIHKKDSIQVSLWQSETELTELAENPELLTETYLIANKASKVNVEGIENTVTLNAESETPWSYTWKSLPIYKTEMKDGIETETDTRYYYYVLEESSTFNDTSMKGKYKSVCTVDDQTLTKTDYTIKNTRHSITVNKKWFDENGFEYSADNLKNDRDEVAFRVYKSNTQAEKPDSLNIVAVGDSITKATSYGVSDNDSYPMKMKSKLTDSKRYQSVNVTKSCENGQHINDLKNSYIGGISSETNIVCLLAGTNDIHHSSGNSGLSCNKGENLSDLTTLKKSVKDEIKTKMTDLVGEIKKKNSDVVIFIGTIPYFVWLTEEGKPMTDASNWWWCSSNFSDRTEYESVCKQLTDAANEAIVEIANDDDKICLVDVCDTLLYTKGTKVGYADSSLYYDGCHLNANGCEKVATAYTNAINNYYAPKEYLAEGNTFTENASLAKVYTAAKSNDWMAVVDLPSSSNDIYYIEEVNQRNNWTVEYQANGQKPGSDTSIIMENHYTPAETSLTLTKKWINDNKTSDADKRNQISLMLLRIPVNKTTGLPIVDKDGNSAIWMQCEVPEITDADGKTVDNPSLVKSGDNEETWVYTYNKLPATDEQGNPYKYKIQERPLEGYTSSNGGITNEVLSVIGESAGNLELENTKTLSIKVKKEWSNDISGHNGDTVKVKVYRSTNETSNSDVKLMLVVNPSGIVNMAKDSAQAITANRNDVKYTSSNEAVAKVENGEIKALGAGTAVITAKSGNEKVEITVNVVALNFTITPGEIAIGETATASLKKSDDSACEGVVYSSSDTTVVTVDSSTGAITAVGVGTATITAEYDGKTITKDIKVKLPDTFTLKSNNSSEIPLNSTIKLTPDPNYGTFTWSSSDTSKVTVDEDGTVHGKVLTAENEEVTITATRNDGKTAEFKVKVVEVKELHIYNAVGDIVDGQKFQIGKDQVLEFTTSKKIIQPKPGDNADYNNYFIEVNKTDDKTFTVKGLNLASHDVNLKITDEQGNTKMIQFNVIERPSVTITASPGKKVTIPESGSETITLTANPSDATFAIDKDKTTSENYGFDIHTGEITVSSNTTEGKITVIASKEGYNNGSITINVQAEGGSSSNTITGDVSGKQIVNLSDDGSDVQIASIVFEVDSTFSQRTWIAFRNSSNGDEDWESSASMVIHNYGSLGISEFNGCTATLDGNTVTVTITKPMNRIAFDANAKLSYTVNLADTQTYSLRSLAPMSLMLDSEPVPAPKETGIVWTRDGDKEFTEIEITASGEWQYVLENLAVMDSENNPYYYWVEETGISPSSLTSYEVSYQFKDDDDKDSDTDTLINAQQAGSNPVAVIRNTYKESEDTSMPETGGTGTEPYKVIGLLIACGALTFLGIKKCRKRA